MSLPLPLSYSIVNDHQDFLNPSYSRGGRARRPLPLSFPLLPIRFSIQEPHPCPTN
jgi:hypothetical protein